jgi:hypothetical protein
MLRIEKYDWYDTNGEYNIEFRVCENDDLIFRFDEHCNVDKANKYVNIMNKLLENK